ncbi:MAG: carbonate dehydratase [Acidiferrobacteraceae bacterium]|nr:carbonate dehydratase [Nitrospinota bacterium]MBP10068.1 carbonate dehydratase [Acidiferrobacteraceae bacterium]
MSQYQMDQNHKTSSADLYRQARPTTGHHYKPARSGVIPCAMSNLSPGLPKWIALIGVLIGFTLLNTVALAAGNLKWSYEGAEGPENWGKIAAAYAACGRGRQQSPIDLSGTIKSELPNISLDWTVGVRNILNNGHTLEVETDNGGTATIGKSSFDLVQFHFHTPSEHAIDGKRAQMEAHFVHANADGALMVVSVMLQPGGDNQLFSRLLESAPRKVGEREISGTVNPLELIPSTQNYWWYMGSLTTPPCSQIVSWVVLKEPILISEKDAASFAELFPNNARPLQPVNHRFVLTRN